MASETTIIVAQIEDLRSQIEEIEKEVADGKADCAAKFAGLQQKIENYQSILSELQQEMNQLKSKTQADDRMPAYVGRKTRQKKNQQPKDSRIVSIVAHCNAINVTRVPSVHVSHQDFCLPNLTLDLTPATASAPKPEKESAPKDFGTFSHQCSSATTRQPLANICKECSPNKTFCTPGNLMTHKERFHGFRCATCNKGYKTKAEQTKHEEQHKCMHKKCVQGRCMACGLHVEFIKMFTAIFNTCQLFAIILATVMSSQLERRLH